MGQELRTGDVNRFPWKTWGSLVSVPGQPWGHQTSSIPSRACLGPWLIRWTRAKFPDGAGCRGMRLWVRGRGGGEEGMPATLQGRLAEARLPPAAHSLG